jgi:hypothetical protein
MSKQSGLYHVSSQLYKDLRSKAILDPNNKDLRSYDSRISLLLTYVTTDEIRKFAKAGFERWNMEHAYMYILDVDKIKGYEHAIMQSTKQQAAYDLKHWSNEMDPVSDEDFPEARKEYGLRRDAYLLSQHGIPTKVPIEAFTENKLYADWASHDWIKYNMKHGDKDQYASYIPHMQLHLNEPLVYQDVVKLF